MSIIQQLDLLPDVVANVRAIIPHGAGQETGRVVAESMTDTVDLTQGTNHKIAFTFPQTIVNVARIGGMVAGTIFIVPKIGAFFKSGGGVGGGGVFQKLGGVSLIWMAIAVALLWDLNNIPKIMNFVFSVGQMGVSGLTSIFD